MRRTLALCTALAACAAPPPDLAPRAARDAPLALPPDLGARPAVTAFDGFYSGAFTPGPANPTACADTGPRTLLVVAGSAASGVNYPLRGAVDPAGHARLTGPGPAALEGDFAADRFSGTLSAGASCRYDVAVARVAP